MPPLNESDQQLLLRHARQALEERLCRGPAQPLAVTPALAEAHGVFVTLHREGKLRGCVGVIEAVGTLAATTRYAAVAAALDDPRFLPVGPEEVSNLQIEISVLSPLVDIDPSQIQVGVHGLLISRGTQRGLLLPQVAADHHWTSERFLQETCRKAGMPADAWQRGARIQAFTAQVIEEGARHAARTT
jgi:AmmeMemoRadiSam system protein A